DLLVVLAPAHLEKRAAVDGLAGTLERPAEALVGREKVLDVVVAHEDPRVEAVAVERRQVGAEALEHLVPVDREITVDDGVELLDQVGPRRGLDAHEALASTRAWMASW